MLEAMILEREAAFAEPLLETDDAVAQAIDLSAATNKPVIIADTQDNPGCGGTCDTTGLLASLNRQGAQDVAMCVMWDGDAALQRMTRNWQYDFYRTGQQVRSRHQPFSGTLRLLR